MPKTRPNRSPNRFEIRKLGLELGMDSAAIRTIQPRNDSQFWDTYRAMFGGYPKTSYREEQARRRNLLLLPR